MKSENGVSHIRKFKAAIAQEIRCNHQLKTAPRDVNARPLFALRFYWWPRQQRKIRDYNQTRFQHHSFA